MSNPVARRELIKLRAYLRFCYKNSKRRRDVYYKASFTDEDSDSYDRSHELTGEVNAFLVSWRAVDNLLKRTKILGQKK